MQLGKPLSILSKTVKHMPRVESIQDTRPKGLRGIAWPSLISGILVKRYKRFIADVQLVDGTTVAAHCPNSGSMKTCCEPGRTVYLSQSDNSRRRLRYTWELIEMPSSLVGVNTSVPNRLVARAVLDDEIEPLSGYDEMRREVTTGDNSRIDLMLSKNDGSRCFVEIKNCTLLHDRAAYFPDAVTSRGLKHLVELGRQVQLGCRAIIFFLIQRMDANAFRPADLIDPAYGAELRAAYRNGVEILTYDVHIDLERITLGRAIPIEL
jgi:sugar fermentation stimulation protein A